MAGAVGLHEAFQGGAQEGQVAHQVHHLVPHGLVLVAQGFVQGAVGPEHHGVVQAAALGEPTGAHEFDVAFQAEGAGHAQFADVLLRW